MKVRTPTPGSGQPGQGSRLRVPARPGGSRRQPSDNGGGE